MRPEKENIEKFPKEKEEQTPEKGVRKDFPEESGKEKRDVNVPKK